MTTAPNWVMGLFCQQPHTAANNNHPRRLRPQPKDKVKRPQPRMAMDKIAETWMFSYAKNNLWRMDGDYDLDDLIQDGRMVWEKIITHYNSTVTEPKHVMALFKTSFSRHIIDLSNKKTKNVSKLNEYKRDVADAEELDTAMAPTAAALRQLLADLEDPTNERHVLQQACKHFELKQPKRTMFRKHNSKSNSQPKVKVERPQPADYLTCWDHHELLNVIESDMQSFLDRFTRDLVLGFCMCIRTQTNDDSSNTWPLIKPNPVT